MFFSAFKSISLGRPHVIKCPSLSMAADREFVIRTLCPTRLLVADPKAIEKSVRIMSLISCFIVLK